MRLRPGNAEEPDNRRHNEAEDSLKSGGCLPTSGKRPMSWFARDTRATMTMSIAMMFRRRWRP